MNTDDYRLKIRQNMTAQEQEEEIKEFNEYFLNGTKNTEAEKNFRRKPYKIESTKLKKGELR